MKTKKQLQKELRELEEIEHKREKELIQTMVNMPEMKKLLKLSNFNNEYEFTVHIKSKCDFCIPPFDYGYGSIHSVPKKTKCSNLAMFVGEPDIDRLEMNSYKNIKSIHPDISKQLNQKIKLENIIINKIKKITQQQQINMSTKKIKELISEAWYATTE